MDVYYIRNMQSKKCNKITLNNLHQAGPNKPIYNLTFHYSAQTGFSPTQELISTATSPCFSVWTGCSADNFIQSINQSVGFFFFSFKVEHPISDSVT